MGEFEMSTPATNVSLRRASRKISKDTPSQQQLSTMVDGSTLALLLHAFTWLNSLATVRSLSLPSPSSHDLHPTQSESERTTAAARLESTCRSLVSIGHLLQSDLYSTSWFDGAVELCDAGGGRKISKEVVAARRIRPGEVLTLYPFHAVGLQTRCQDVDRRKTPTGDALGATSWFWKDEDLEHFMRDGRSRSLRETISEWDDPFWNGAVVHLDVNVERPTVPGWLGHLVKTEPARRQESGNCILVPLVPPLCALVATKSIGKGTRLRRRATTADPAVVRDLARKARSTHSQPLAELRSHLRMAYAPAMPQSGESEPQHEFSVDALRHPFHCIDRTYSGISTLHTDPDVLFIDNFLTDDECERLMAKARSHLAPSLVKNEGTGAVEQDLTRTSSDTNVPQREIPSIVSRIAALANCTLEQLEIVQILRYTKGQYFLPHTDGFQGPTTACGFQRSGRLVTIFCYLNDVPIGGESHFPLLNVSVSPRKGSAVVHFPSTTGFEEDLRTEHEGSVADDEKWLLATWVWKDRRTDAAYAEDKLPSLSDDII
jgi:prolyl 4-hydroxylase